jgi:hypothetical protein
MIGAMNVKVYVGVNKEREEAQSINISLVPSNMLLYNLIK